MKAFQCLRHIRHTVVPGLGAGCHPRGFVLSINDMAQLPYHWAQGCPIPVSTLRLHAHSEVWDSFISSFGTYQPLMAAIKNEYDTALHKALFASAENMSMRTRLAEAEERKVEGGPSLVD